jgi:tRNA(adenine34) deaminase
MDSTRLADDHAMRIALDQAHNAWLAGEVPVGAVIMRAGQVIATGYNRPITTHDPTAHAEIVALRHAAHLLSNYRLPECELYVTLEPCAMCAMALMHARFKRVVFAAWDPKTGVAGSVTDLFALRQLNHHTEVHGGVLAEQSSQMLKAFFAERRAQIKALRDARQSAAGLQALHGGLDVLESELAPGQPPLLPEPDVDELRDAEQPMPVAEVIEGIEGLAPGDFPPPADVNPHV